MKTYEEWCAETAPVMAAAGRGEAIQARETKFNGDGSIFRQNPWIDVGEYWGRNWTYLAPYDDLILTEFRIKPKTIMIGDIEVPEPLREAPEEGTTYYVPQFNSERMYPYTFRYRNDDFDKEVLKIGFMHLTKEAAEQHAKALIKVSGGKVEDE